MLESRNSQVAAVLIGVIILPLGLYGLLEGHKRHAQSAQTTRVHEAQERSRSVQQEMWEEVPEELLRESVEAYRALPANERAVVTEMGVLLRESMSGRAVKPTDPLTPYDIYHAMASQGKVALTPQLAGR